MSRVRIVGTGYTRRISFPMDNVQTDMKRPKRFPNTRVATKATKDERKKERTTTILMHKQYAMQKRAGKAGNCRI